jgi:hypothetical protein
MERTCNDGAKNSAIAGKGVPPLRERKTRMCRAPQLKYHQVSRRWRFGKVHPPATARRLSGCSGSIRAPPPERRPPRRLGWKRRSASDSSQRVTSETVAPELQKAQQLPRSRGRQNTAKFRHPGPRSAALCRDAATLPRPLLRHRRLPHRLRARGRPVRFSPSAAPKRGSTASLPMFLLSPAM